jgi:hypothetical protein
MPVRRGPLVFSAALSLALAKLASANEPTKQECVSANENAQDLQRAGKLKDARAQFAMCTAKACPAVVREDCAERLRALDKVLPSVVFTLVVSPKNASKFDLSAVRVAVDGAISAQPLDGTALSVDPGEHTFTFSVGERPPVSLNLSLHDGERLQRQVVLDATSSAGHEPPSSENRMSLTRLIGWSALGAGAAGVTLGSIFGIVAVSTKPSLSSECHDRACPAFAQRDIDSLHFNAVAANVSFAIGVLGLGAGGALLLLFPEDKSPNAVPERAASLGLHAWVGIGHAGVAGTFR